MYRISSNERRIKYYELLTSKERAPDKSICRCSLSYEHTKGKDFTFRIEVVLPETDINLFDFSATCSGADEAATELPSIDQYDYCNVDIFVELE